MPKTIIDDNRKILTVACGSTSWTVGSDDVTKIVPYEESGHMALVTWFAVYKGEFLAERVCAGLDTVVIYDKSSNVVDTPIVKGATCETWNDIKDTIFGKWPYYSSTWENAIQAIQKQLYENGVMHPTEAFEYDVWPYNGITEEASFGMIDRCHEAYSILQGYIYDRHGTLEGKWLTEFDLDEFNTFYGLKLVSALKMAELFEGIEEAVDKIAAVSHYGL